jgi:WD40 repeat protein
MGGYSDHIVEVWSMETGQLVHSIDDQANDVVFSPNGKLLASASRDHTVKIWSVESGNLLHIFKGHTTHVNVIAFSPDGKIIASGCGKFDMNENNRDYTVKLWSVAAGKLLFTLKGHGYDINTLSFSPDGKTIASGSVDNSVKIWSVSTGMLVKTLNGGNHGGVNNIVFSPDGKTLITWNGTSINEIWNPADGKMIAKLTTFKDGEWVVQDSNGRFDCSNCATDSEESGKNYIRWWEDGALYQNDQFFNEQWTQGLLAKVMGLSSGDF